MVYFPICLYVAPIINSMAFSPNRGCETGEGGHSNKAMTTVAQTKELARKERKIAENRDENKATVCPQRQGWGRDRGMAGERKGFKWRVGREGRWGTACLNQALPVYFSSLFWKKKVSQKPAHCSGPLKSHLFPRNRGEPSRVALHLN